VFGFAAIAETEFAGAFSIGAPLLERKDRVADSSTSVGVGSFTLAGTAPTGFRTFAAAHTTNSKIRYCITSADRSEWEVGEGIWTVSGAALTRETVYASSNSNALVNFSAGTKDVISVLTATDMAAPVDYSTDKLNVYLGSATNSTSAGWQKLPVASVSYDTGGIWNSSTRRATPRRAGYYQVTMRSYTATGGSADVGIYMNGSLAISPGTGTFNDSSAGGTAMVYCDGTTDYIEPYVNIASVRAFTTGLTATYFQVFGPL